MGNDQPMDPKFWRRVEEGVFERFGENRKDWIRLGWSLLGWSMLVCPVFLEFSVERPVKNSQNSKINHSGSKVRVLMGLLTSHNDDPPPSRGCLPGITSLLLP